jgi:hypothetical protein
LEGKREADIEIKIGIVNFNGLNPSWVAKGGGDRRL